MERVFSLREGVMSQPNWNASDQPQPILRLTRLFASTHTEAFRATHISDSLVVPLVGAFQASFSIKETRHKLAARIGISPITLADLLAGNR